MSKIIKYCKSIKKRRYIIIMKEENKITSFIHNLFLGGNTYDSIRYFRKGNRGYKI